MICGFEWKTDEHICCCESEGEHDYDNPRHFCECGERIDCERNEVSYEQTQTFGDPLTDDPEIPF